MADYFQRKMKRKGLEDVTDDFSDFPFASPATKIRRLNVGLPPIVGEEEPPEILVEQLQLLQEQSLGSNGSAGTLKIEELPNVPENEERAIVVFQPSTTAPFSQSPSNFSVDPHVFSGLRDQIFWPRQSNSWKLAGDDDDEVAKEDGVTRNGCQAIIPWAPPQHPPAQIDSGENMMDAEELGEAAMEVEDEDSTGSVWHRNGDGGLNQWQQQHCMIPQPPLDTTPPIFWYR